MNRKSFLQTSTSSVLGYAGMALGGGLAYDSKKTYSAPSDLKITDIRGCVLATHFTNPIIKIYTNQDIYGIGEVRDAGWLASALLMKPYLVGRNPMDIESILASVRHLSGHGRYGGGYSAIDIALMDLMGKALDMPCWALLDNGNKQREEVEMYSTLGHIDDSPRFEHFLDKRLEVDYKHYKYNVKNLRQVEGALEAGLPTQKGLQIWGDELLKLREKYGYNVSISAQAFGYQTAESAIEVGNYLAQPQFGLEYMEEMIPYNRFNSVNLNRQIVDSSRTPNQAGENIFGFENFVPFIEAGALDYIHPDMLTSGGMIETKKIADYAEIHGIPTIIHAAPSPIAIIAKVHCAATIRSFHSLEYQFRWNYMPWWEDLVTGIEKPIIRKGGVIKVPDGPGLGITLNEEVAEKYLMLPENLPFDSGLFKPTPQFDQPMRLAEARKKGLIGYPMGNFNWWHVDENLEYGFKPRS